MMTVVRMAGLYRERSIPFPGFRRIIGPPLSAAGVLHRD
jgi:hypothetical protein